MSKTLLVYLVGFLLIFDIRKVFGQDDCQNTFVSIGCYKDHRKNRALPDLIINDRFRKDLWTSYQSVLPSLICRCAKKAEAKGYRVFAIQFYAECWAGNDFKFLRHKSVNHKCIDSLHQTCPLGGTQRRCTGKANANFIYVMTAAILRPQTPVPTTAMKPVTTAPVKPLRDDCKNPLDMALVVDASGSISKESFEMVKTFLKDLTHQFNVSLDGTHFACLHYDHRVHKDFQFNDKQYYNQTNLDAKLAQISHPSGATVTQNALRAAITFYDSESGARSNSEDYPRILVVFTDGVTFGGKSTLIGPVAELKNKADVKIVAIGIGDQVDVDELKVMAGEHHYVMVNSFSDLANSMGVIMDCVCHW